jgi:hypothetical protein
MRARELLEENYSENLNTDLNNILVGAKGAGAKEISTDDVVTQLYNMGYSVDANSLLPLLMQNPIIMNATPEMISFAAPESVSTGTGNVADSAARVGDMAQKATNIG